MIRETIRPCRVAARIPLHLDACDEAVDALVELHERVGRACAGGLHGDDEAAALWELSGHALGLARAYLSLLRGGYVPAAGVMARALHETLVGLSALTGLDGDAVLDHYLADHGIDMESARAAVQKTQRRAERDGVELDDDLRSLAGGLYKLLSGYAHNRRRAVREAVLHESGSFAYGPHPDAHQRGLHASYAILLMVQLVEGVSLGLSRFGGFTDAHATLAKPLIARLEEVEQRHPLSRSVEGPPGS